MFYNVYCYLLVRVHYYDCWLHAYVSNMIECIDRRRGSLQIGYLQSSVAYNCFEEVNNAGHLKSFTHLNDNICDIWFLYMWLTNIDITAGHGRWTTIDCSYWHCAQWANWSSSTRSLLRARCTRARRRAECWADYGLIRTVLSPIPPQEDPYPPLNTAKLNRTDAMDGYQSHLDNMLTVHEPLIENPSAMWDPYKQMVTESAENIIGQKKRVLNDWFDKNNVKIGKPLKENHRAFMEWQNDNDSKNQRKIASSFRVRLRKYYIVCNTAGEVHDYVYSNKWKDIVIPLKTVNGSQTQFYTAACS